jgi:thymidylate synthase ThyX
VIQKETEKLNEQMRANVTKLCSRIEDMTKAYGITDMFSALDQGLHKQHANRVLEPYAFHTVIVSSSYWRNFFGLRDSCNAQPEAQDFGIACTRAMMMSVPNELSLGEWHLPYIRKEDRQEEKDQMILARVSAGKCARTSYLTHDGVRALEKDIELADSLQKNGHMSPFEHVARPFERGDPKNSHGNFSPVWMQFRKILSHEDDFTKVVSREELLLGCRGDEALADFILSLRE